jgi:hypothetical protein
MIVTNANISFNLLCYSYRAFSYIQYINQQMFFFARQPPVGQGLLIHEVSRSHTTAHHSR